MRHWAFGMSAEWRNWDVRTGSCCLAPRTPWGTFCGCARTDWKPRSKKLAAQGTPLLGICGGYQMLGRSLSDPDGVEEGGMLAGMGLLPCDTVFLRRKIRRRTRAKVVAPMLAGKFGRV